MRPRKLSLQTSSRHARWPQFFGMDMLGNDPGSTGRRQGQIPSEFEDTVEGFAAQATRGNPWTRTLTLPR
jgi:hypothetical protein